jgi:hypothetical protein
MPGTRVRLALRLLAGVVLLGVPARAQFAPSVNPIPLAALQISYRSLLNAWEFVDRFAMPYERTVVLLCAAPAASACGLRDLEYTGPCAGLAAHPVLAAAAWRNVGAPDACLRTPAVNASMRGASRNRLLIDNNFTALRRFDATPRAANASGAAIASDAGAIELRVRFVYLQGLAGDAVHLRSAGYALAMAPLQAAPNAVHVRSECSARGLFAPDSHLPPALGGGVLEVQLATVLGEAQRLCTWQCELPFVKMPWNDPALSETRRTSSGRCAATPASFTAVALSFAVRFPANQTLRFDSARMLLGIDRIAEDMAAALAPRFGELAVLLSLRNSSVNTRDVGGVLEWARDVNARLGFSLEARDNPDFGLGRDLAAPVSNAGGARRLLQAPAGVTGATYNVLVVDGVIVSPRNDVATCCLADDAVAAQRSLPAGKYDLDDANSVVEPAQVQTTLFVTQNSYEQEYVEPTPSAQTEGSSGWILFLLFCVLVVLVCLCCSQQGGFHHARDEECSGNAPERDTQEL